LTRALSAALSASDEDYMAYLFSLVTLFAASLVVPLHAQTADKNVPAANSGYSDHVTEPGPPLVYRSTFDMYRALRDVTLLPWRAANDRVGAIGGWRFYAREAQQSNGPSTGQPTPAPPPAATPHHKH
jgi:hypothetical protein